MRVLVTGALGMLGHKVVAEAQRRGHEAVAADIDEFDLTDAAATRAFVGDARPDAVVNCAAYTNVDGAEEHEDVALAVNGDGAGNVAAAAALPVASIALIFVSGGNVDIKTGARAHAVVATETFVPSNP